MFHSLSVRGRLLILVAMLATLATTPLSATAAPPPAEPNGSVTPVPITPGAWTALGSYGGNLGGGVLNSTVHAIAVSGSNVYVGGSFLDAAGNSAADYIALWDGTNWSALGAAAPINGQVNAILVDGANVYVGGQFSNAGGDQQADNLAVFNTTSATWSDIAGAASGDGVIPGQVHALAKNGANLYVGGYFHNSPAIGGTSTPNAGDMILRWDGSWHALGARPCCSDTGNGNLNGTVYALLATSTGVIAGGFFSDVAGDTSIDYLAQFDLNTYGWTRFGNLALNSSGYVFALAGSSSNLFVGGNFTNANGLPQADYFVRWNGVEWIAPGSSNGVSAIQDRVYSIAVSGANVFVGGNFVDAGGETPKPTADRVAKWNGSAWSGLGSNGSNDGAIQTGGEPPGYVRALGLTANALFVGGSFTNVANIVAADFFAAYGIGATTNQKPDGRIKKGSGSLVGNNIYNTTGLNQTRSGTADVNATITFTISIQNDGTQSGRFKVAATASGNVNFQVTYFRGTTNITTAVVNGTYVTGSVAPGNVWAIKAKVKVVPSVVSGATTTRLITITSNSDSSKVDAVKFIGKRS